jgi:hypothetical protein
MRPPGPVSALARIFRRVPRGLVRGIGGYAARCPLCHPRRNPALPSICTASPPAAVPFSSQSASSSARSSYSVTCHGFTGTGVPKAMKSALACSLRRAGVAMLGGNGLAPALVAVPVVAGAPVRVFGAGAAVGNVRLGVQPAHVGRHRGGSTKSGDALAGT